MTDEVKTYEGLIDASPTVGKIITPEMANAVFGCNEHTVNSLGKLWSENLRKNIVLYKKHGSFLDAFGGFGINKAVIGVGAGPSFNRNKEVLKEVYELNTQVPLEKQPFLIVASNKQLKPLLEMGIFPHFTLLIDAGDALLPQFQGLPKWARKGILVAGLNTSHKILKEWDRQGGQICFFLIGGDDEKKFFEKETGEDAERLHIQQGGNVLNTLWILNNRVLGSTVYMMVGNDLSFKYSTDKEERERSFYADGDYRLNILNRRDEAKDQLGWMGFDLFESAFEQGKHRINLAPVGISKQLWVYKVWLEVQAAIWAEKVNFFIFNCSEAGVSGVLAREYGKSFFERENWFLIDEILPKWHTTTLRRACEKFLEVLKWQETPTGILDGAERAVVSPVGTDTARIIVPNKGLSGSVITL